MSINLYTYTLKQQMVLTPHTLTNVYLMQEPLRNIQVTYEHAQLKGGNKDPFRVGLKLKDNGWVYVQGLTHYEVKMASFY